MALFEAATAEIKGRRGDEREGDSETRETAVLGVATDECVSVQSYIIVW